MKVLPVMLNHPLYHIGLPVPPTPPSVALIIFYLFYFYIIKTCAAGLVGEAGLVLSVTRILKASLTQFTVCVCICMYVCVCVCVSTPPKPLNRFA